MTIAQCFSVGNETARELSPEGTAEMNPFRPQFSRPFGTWTSSLPNPTLKRWAIVMKSLRDMQLVIGNPLLIGHCSLVILWGLVIGHFQSLSHRLALSSPAALPRGSSLQRGSNASRLQRGRACRSGELLRESPRWNNS